MNPEGLLALYSRVADTSDAMMRLRRFILDLAVQGKLISQCPADEPALRHLEDNVGSNLKGRGISSDVAVGNIETIPRSWAWLPLGGIIGQMDAGWSPQCEARPRDSDEQWAVLKTTAVQQLAFDATQNKRLPHKLKPRPKYQAEVGDILVTRAGPRNRVGVSCVVDVPCPRLMISDKLIRFHPLGEISSRYIALALNAGRTLREIEQAKSGMAVMQMNISQDKLRSVAIPVPPVAEQRRIVAKVDELMALCDQLEKARAQREEKRDKLTAATLARLNKPNPETFRNDARFALDNFQALTTRSDQIKQLRQTVLSLAVRGKLTTQMPGDEPAAELLRRLALRKLELMQTSGDARIKVAPDPSPDALPITLPTGWSLQSFDNLFLFVDYRGKTPEKTSSGIPLITAKNIRMGTLNREPREYIAEKTYRSWMTRGFPRVGDLLFTTEAPLANVCLNELNEPFALAQRAICLQPYGEINTRFLMLAIMSDVVQSMIEQQATGMTAKGIKAANLKPLPLPIPPLSEQQRIVDKVASLFELCDRLELAIGAASTAQIRLLDALIANSLHPNLKIEDTSVPPAQQHWQRRAS